MRGARTPCTLTSAASRPTSTAPRPCATARARPATTGSGPAPGRPASSGGCWPPSPTPTPTAAWPSGASTPRATASTSAATPCGTTSPRWSSSTGRRRSRRRSTRRPPRSPAGWPPGGCTTAWATASSRSTSWCSPTVAAAVAEGRPPTMSDALLDALEADRSGELHDIVATIQQAQYEVITQPLDQLLIVQGGPGTGKTQVGLHRVSWMLHNHADQPRAGRRAGGGAEPGLHPLHRRRPAGAGRAGHRAAADHGARAAGPRRAHRPARAAAPEGRPPHAAGDRQRAAVPPAGRRRARRGGRRAPHRPPRRQPGRRPRPPAGHPHPQRGRTASCGRSCWRRCATGCPGRRGADLSIDPVARGRGHRVDRRLPGRRLAAADAPGATCSTCSPTPTCWPAPPRAC